MSMRSILEAERFEEKLRKLAAMSPQDKRKHWSRINAREKRMTEDHAWMNCQISERRAVCDAMRKEDEELYEH